MALVPSSQISLFTQEFRASEEKEHQSRKKSQNHVKGQSMPRPPGLSGTRKVSEGGSGTSAQNPWLSGTGHRLVRASQTKPASSCEELV